MNIFFYCQILQLTNINDGSFFNQWPSKALIFFSEDFKNYQQNDLDFEYTLFFIFGWERLPK